MDYIKRIFKFGGKNLNDVFRLDCVKLIMKLDSGEPLLVLRSECMRKSADVCKCTCQIGEKLVQYENGEWEVRQ